MNYPMLRIFKQKSPYLAVLVSLFLVGCATNSNIPDQQYHFPLLDSKDKSKNIKKVVDGFSVVSENHKEEYGHTYDYTSTDLHYLEYKENGEKFDSMQLDAINRAIANSDKPVYLVVYVHGWHNNASIDETNPSLDTTGFPYLLARRNFQKPDMNVIGIYIGWRGEESKSFVKAFSP